MESMKYFFPKIEQWILGGQFPRSITDIERKYFIPCLVNIFIYGGQEKFSPKNRTRNMGRTISSQYYGYWENIFFHFLFIKHIYLWKSRNIISQKYNYEYGEDNFLSSIVDIERKYFLLKLKLLVLILILGGMFS